MRYLGCGRRFYYNPITIYPPGPRFEQKKAGALFIVANLLLCRHQNRWQRQVSAN